MGNCCGKPKNEDAFQGGGRTLNATPATTPLVSNGGRSAAVPKVGGPPRTLRSAPAGPGESLPANVAAAQAAQERFNSPKPRGKLQKDLDAQRGMTHHETLNQAAKDNLNARDQLISTTASGKLQKDLDAQRAQTHNQTLTQAAKDNLAMRNADANAQARNWD